ncbi:MAG TPA: hypothetical protein DIS66_02730 [Candidatus Omnitrophica bacterium]|nr:hypothetical protein [Candidatus Omnitrophota bacterium]
MNLVMKKSLYPFILLGFAAFPLLSCATRPVTPSGDAPYFNWIQPSRPESSLTGKAYFWPGPENVKIKVVLTGAAPNKKYFAQIHEKGACSDEAESAGNIFRPTGSFLGIQTKESGLLAEIESTGKGTAELEGDYEKFSLTRSSIAGKSIVISEDKNAQVRAGCAVIPVPPAN